MLTGFVISSSGYHHDPFTNVMNELPPSFSASGAAAIGFGLPVTLVSTTCMCVFKISAMWEIFSHGSSLFPLVGRFLWYANVATCNTSRGCGLWEKLMDSLADGSVAFLSASICVNA